MSQSLIGNNADIEILSLKNNIVMKEKEMNILSQEWKNQ